MSMTTMMVRSLYDTYHMPKHVPCAQCWLHTANWGLCWTIERMSNISAELRGTTVHPGIVMRCVQTAQLPRACH